MAVINVFGKDGIKNNTGAVVSNHIEEKINPDVSKISNYSNYTQYLADHYICEIYLGSVADSIGIRNWRYFTERLNRTPINNKPVDDRVFLIYEEPLSLSVKNDYKALGDTSLFKVLKGGAAVGKAAQKGVQIANMAGKAGASMLSGFQSDIAIAPSRILDAQFYVKSNPLRFNTTFKFRFGQYGLWNAFEEVFKPAMAFLIMSSPSILGAAIETPGPTDIGLIASVFKGIGSTVSDKYGEPGFMEDLIGNLTNAEGYGKFAKHLTIIIGQTSVDNKNTTSQIKDGKADTIFPANDSDNQKGFNEKYNIDNLFSFRPCVLKGCDVTFSKEKTEKGYPISATVKLDIETQFPVVTRNFGELTLDRKAIKYDTDARLEKTQNDLVPGYISPTTEAIGDK